LTEKGFDAVAELIELALDGIALSRARGQQLAQLVPFLDGRLKFLYLLAESGPIVFGRCQLGAKLLADRHDCLEVIFKLGDLVF
jgi:hypothetical protein